VTDDRTWRPPAFRRSQLDHVIFAEVTDDCKRHVSTAFGTPTPWNDEPRLAGATDKHPGTLGTSAEWRLRQRGTQARAAHTEEARWSLTLHASAPRVARLLTQSPGCTAG
jgi:hypothetical protein